MRCAKSPDLRFITEPGSASAIGGRTGRKSVSKSASRRRLASVAVTVHAGKKIGRFTTIARMLACRRAESGSPLRGDDAAGNSASLGARIRVGTIGATALMVGECNCAKPVLKFLTISGGPTLTGPGVDCNCAKSDLRLNITGVGSGAERKM